MIGAMPGFCPNTICASSIITGQSGRCSSGTFERESAASTICVKSSVAAILAICPSVARMPASRMPRLSISLRISIEHPGATSIADSSGKVSNWSRRRSNEARLDFWPSGISGKRRSQKSLTCMVLMREHTSAR